MDREIKQPDSVGSLRKGRRARKIALVGAALALVVALGWLGWRARHQPPAEPPWDEQAIAAQFTNLTIRKTEKDLHLIFRYALTNGTDKDYRLPMPKHGVLMKRTEDGALYEVDTAMWEEGMVVPRRRTMVAEFDLSVDPAVYNTDVEALEKNDNRAAFAKQRLREIRGLVFLDFEKHYRFELPRGWD